MKIYRVMIRADRDPMEYTVNASNWGTAARRAIKEWQARFKGSRTDQLNIRIIKGGQLLEAKEEE